MNLNQVTVPSSDVNKSVDFYRRLGLRLIVDSRPRYARFECPDGDATFSVEQRLEPMPQAGIVVYFECEDLDATVMALKKQGLAIDAEPVDQHWLWREAYLKDPDGNRICLYKAGENRRSPPWRLKTEPGF